MARSDKDTTALKLLAAYDALVAKTAEDAAESAALRAAYQRRTGAFGPEDPWFETRSRALWDDVVTSPGFPYARAHRGFFVVAEGETETEDADWLLVDLWSGAELCVRHLDDAQSLALDHAEGPIDARVVVAGDPPALYILPGAYHHAADALDPATAVLGGARDRGMQTTEALDALMRMDLVFRSSSRVKASFAYKVDALSRSR